MNIADVNEFYQRNDAFKARGDEGSCAGCGTVLAPEQPYSVYVLAGKPRTPRAFPPSMLLCQKCTYMVLGSNMAPPPESPG